MNPTRSYWELLAEKLRTHPELLEVAHTNISRWRCQGQSAPQRLAQWEELLTQAQAGGESLEGLLAVLLNADEQSARLREFNPFAGILTREERRQARELCGYRH